MRTACDMSYENTTFPFLWGEDWRGEGLNTEGVSHVLHAVVSSPSATSCATSCRECMILIACDMS